MVTPPGLNSPTPSSPPVVIEMNLLSATSTGRNLEDRQAARPTHQRRTSEHLAIVSTTSQGASSAAGGFSAEPLPQEGSLTQLPSTGGLGRLPALTPDIQAASQSHQATLDAYQALLARYTSGHRLIPSADALAAVARAGAMTGAATGGTFGVGVTFGNAVVNGTFSDMAPHFKDGGATTGIGAGDWAKGTFKNTVDPVTGYPPDENLAVVATQSLARTALAPMTGAAANMVVMNGIGGAVGGLADTMAGRRSLVVKVDPSSVYPDPNPLDARGRPHDDAAMAQLFAPVIAARARMAQLQKDNENLAGNFARGVGSVAFSGGNALNTSLQQYPFPTRLGLPASVAAGVLVSSAAGLVTQWVVTAKQLLTTVEAPLLDNLGLTQTNPDGSIVMQNMPIFEAVRRDLPDIPGRNIFTNSHLYRGAAGQMTTFNGGRTGMASVQHYWDQYVARAKGIFSAVAAQAPVNVVAAAVRNQLGGSVAGRIAVGAVQSAVNLSAAVASWFKESTRLNVALSATSNTREQQANVLAQCQLNARSARQIVEDFQRDILPLADAAGPAGPVVLNPQEQARLQQDYDHLHTLMQMSGRALAALEDSRAPDAQIIEGKMNYWQAQRAVVQMNQMLVVRPSLQVQNTRPAYTDDNQVVNISL